MCLNKAKDKALRSATQSPNPIESKHQEAKEYQDIMIFPYHNSRPKQLAKCNIWG